MRKQSLFLFPVVALLLGGGAFLYLGAPQGSPAGSVGVDGAAVVTPAPPRSLGEISLDGKTVVRMTASGFEPANFHVHEGEVVVWVNEDKDPRWPASDLHPTHTIYPELDPQEPVMPGHAWNVTLSKPGTWKFHDHLKPYFVGTVTVEEN